MVGLIIFTVLYPIICTPPPLRFVLCYYVGRVKKFNVLIRAVSRINYGGCWDVYVCVVVGEGGPTPDLGLGS